MIVNTHKELVDLACKGLNDTFISHLRTKPNLFDLMFEWVDVMEYVKILRFKQFRTVSENYAPYFTYLFNKPTEFFYEGKSNPFFLYTTTLGSVSIKYPAERCYVKIIGPIYDDMYKKGIKRIEDFTDILIVDYSPETISKLKRFLNANEKKRKRELKNKEGKNEKKLKL